MAERKWAKIINNETKECSVGLGTDENFYASIGFSLMSVEQGWDEAWYVEGFAPTQKPQEVINEEIIKKDQEFLNETDWYVIRYAENGKTVPENIIQERERCRKEISELRGDVSIGGNAQ